MAGSLPKSRLWQALVSDEQIRSMRVVASSIGASNSASPRATLEQAAALQRRGDHKGAIRQYQELLKNAPGDPRLLNMCAMATAESGDLKASADMLKKAVASDPAYADGWINLGLILQQAGDNEAACGAYGRYRALHPDSPIGHLNFANVCQLLQRFEAAAPAYEQALALAPENPVIWSNLSRASLHLGDWNKAINAADRALALSPGNSGALAIKSAALLELGRMDDMAELVDFDRLIEKLEFTAPDGYSDLNDFNESLCAYCLAHPSLVYEPSDKTTKKGHQTGNLSLDPDTGPVGRLIEMINKAVRDYQASHPVDPSHPFLAQRPSRWNIDIWSTILGSQGHQMPHIHRSGWLSGCYYANIPDVIAADSGDAAGWIEFGRPQEHPHAQAKPVVRSYQPNEGMAVLFPSYFYHRTKPFESDDKRISIAFDIIPAT